MFTFETIFPWAILPEKMKLGSASSALEEKKIYKNEFRWLRRNRQKEFCYSWRLGQQVGYAIKSPITFRMEPFVDYELESDLHQDELEHFLEISGAMQLWKRDGFYIAVTRGGEWLRINNYRHGDSWQGFFVPNGEGTVEWNLGFKVFIPQDYYLMVLPYDERNEGFSVPIGVFTYKTIQALNNKNSFAIAIKPLKTCMIKRNEPIARLILLHKDSFEE
jgi:hypothetical protein